MTGSGGLAYDRYRTGSSDEWLMRIGDPVAAPVLILPPLFEELNRTRAFLASLMRALASRGFGCWLPDLPGTGESSKALEAVSWDEWRHAASDAAGAVGTLAGRPPLLVAVRGGALLDDACELPWRWRFAPVEGASLARDLVRAAMLGKEELTGPVVELAGYPIPQALLTSLQQAAFSHADGMRTARLDSDRAEADLKLKGPSLWRRSEPGNAPELADLLAADISQWARQCGAC